MYRALRNGRWKSWRTLCRGGGREQSQMARIPALGTLVQETAIHKKSYGPIHVHGRKAKAQKWSMRRHGPLFISISHIMGSWGLSQSEMSCSKLKEQRKPFIICFRSAASLGWKALEARPFGLQPQGPVPPAGGAKPRGGGTLPLRVGGVSSAEQHCPNYRYFSCPRPQKSGIVFLS